MNSVWTSKRQHALLAAGAGFLLLTCQGAEPQESPGSEAVAGTKPPILLISIDTLRSDHLPVYGYDGVATPAIDRLRADSLLFERAYSPIPLTLPAHASLLTGLLPHQHGVRDNSGFRLAEDIETFAERLVAEGYRTAAVVSSFVMRRATGIAQGFEFYDDEIEQLVRATAAETQRDGREVLEGARELLNGFGEEPFFLMVHFYEPHAPYEPPPPFDQVAHPYDGEIAAVDALVGELLAELRRLERYDEAIVVLLSDHGEGLGEHGEDQHGILLHREALQVPLIVKLPGAERRGQSVTEPAQLSDVPGTLLALVAPGGAAPLGNPAPTLLELAEHPQRPIFAETFYPQLRLGWHGLTSVIEGDLHWIEGAYGELFDLAVDPGEQNDLGGQRAEPLRAALAEASIEPPQARDSSAAEEEDREALLSLGYLSSEATLPATDLPDPRQEIESLATLQRGIDSLRLGRAQDAVQLLARTVNRHPRLLDAWQFLAVAYEESGQPEPAYEAYRRAFAISGGSGLYTRALARLSFDLGRLDEAATFVPLAIEADPSDLSMRALRTSTYLALERMDEALESARDNLARDEANIELLYQLATVYMGRRDLDVAEEGLRSVLARDARYLPALADLGVLLASQERWREAKEVFTQLVALAPDDPRAKASLEYVESRL